jgi:uncharacterized protein (TIGR02246 family)
MIDRSVAHDASVQELLDKQAIREVVMRYCRGVDRGDAELLRSSYHADGVDERFGSVHTGAEVGEIVASMLETMQSTCHQITTQTIEVRGDAAVAESYSTGHHVLKDGRRLHTLVRYLDHFERRDGEWRISHRNVVVDGSEVLDPLEGPNVAPSTARRDRSDPSYALFVG